MSAIAESLAARAEELAGRREPFVHATVVRAQHPTSAHAGDTALVLPTGEIHGFVGGNCVEASVREFSLQVLASQEPLLLRVLPGEPARTAEEGAVAVSNPCLSGGAIEIFLQPRIPAPRVLVVGTTPVAQALATLGSGVGLDVELTDGASAAPRGDDAALIVASHGKIRGGRPGGGPARGRPVRCPRGQRDPGRRRPGIPRRRRRPPAAGVHARRAAARSPDSRGNRAFNPGPAGWGTVEGAACRRALCGRPWRPHGYGGRSPESGPWNQVPRSRGPASAIDPVCGMSVPAVESSLHLDHNGVTVYFCSPGCRTAFRIDPGRYALTT